MHLTNPQIADASDVHDWLANVAASSELSARQDTPYELEFDDLYFLYRLVREQSVVSILEFGSGWSTLVFARALKENRRNMVAAYDVRHPNPFQLMSVDASPQWQKIALSRIPSEWAEIIVPVVATPRLTTEFGGIASCFDFIPAFVPDLVYLDGPDPEQVEGEIDGFRSLELHGLPMSADLLRLEPHLWPGTMIVTDGRTANARFLKPRFRRYWESLFDPFGDRTIMRLTEIPLGAVSERHMEARLKAARLLRGKEGPVIS